MSGATRKDLQLSVAALRLQTWTQRKCSPVHVELRLHLVWPNTKPRMPSRYREGLAAKTGISIGQQILQAAFVTAPSFGDPKLLPKCSSMLHSGHLSLTASVGYMMVILPDWLHSHVLSLIRNSYLPRNSKSPEESFELVRLLRML